MTLVALRPGVVFRADAADAFQRAERQVNAEFKRNIDVNRTTTDYNTQLKMHNASVAYLNGTGPYPGHSYAVHPRESFHVSGTALDSDDWRIPRIIYILAINGFIRNRLTVKGEDHHFEYLEAKDQNKGKPANLAGEDEEMLAILEIKGNSAAQKSLYDLRTGRAIRAITPDENTSLRSSKFTRVAVSLKEYRERGGF